jgi:hypothetical protein
MFGECCQYSTGAKQLMGLVVLLIICRGGKGVGVAPVRPCSDEKSIARRWQEVLLPANLRPISHAHQ